MLLFLVTDFALPIPGGLLLDKLILNFDMMDLVFWYPRLSWSELGKCALALIGSKILVDQIERWALAPVKRRVRRWCATACKHRWPLLSKRLHVG